MPEPPSGPEHLDWSRLAQYKGPKLGKQLRRDVKHEIHRLFEHLEFLRQIDPRVEEDLRRFKMTEALDLYAKAVGTRRDGSR